MRACGGMVGAGGGGRRFCVVSLEAPHPPYAAAVPEGVARRFGADGAGIVLPANVPLGGEVEAQARRELAGYYAHIEATDRAVARLVAAVDATAVAQGRTSPVIVFTSAHGDMHGAHGLFRKGWPYEESVRVPLLVRRQAGGGGGGTFGGSGVVAGFACDDAGVGGGTGVALRTRMGGHLNAVGGGLAPPMRPRVAWTAFGGTQGGFRRRSALVVV
ncbi:hypothetical protein Ga0100230_020660 [Opitutaceae bacterium TAV3]|nr:hypothetical protein Ga0100230_020660 [Opitutaceae bacterium TAV3]